MSHNLSSFKKKCIIGGLLILIVISGILIYLGQRQKDTLILSDFKTEEMYCYKGIPWRTAEDEVEKILGISLEQNSAIPNYYDCGSVKLKEYNASFQMEFTDSALTSVIFQFPADEENQEQDYQLLEQEILDEFVKNYGDYTEQVEYTSIEGGKRRSTRWIVTNSENLTSFLYVGASYNSQRVLELTIMTGEMPPKAETEQVGANEEEFLKTLKDDDGYCYADVEWGMTREEMEEAADVKLSEYGVPTLLQSDREVSLYGVNGTELFEFSGEELLDIQIYFDGENLNDFSESLLEDLEKLYGECDREFSSDDVGEESYLWEILDENGMQESCMQVTKLYSDDKIARVILSSGASLAEQDLEAE